MKLNSPYFWLKVIAVFGAVAGVVLAVLSQVPVINEFSDSRTYAYMHNSAVSSMIGLIITSIVSGAVTFLIAVILEKKADK